MRILSLIVLASLLFSCKNDKKPAVEKSTEKVVKDALIYPEETHFKSIRQVTFGGDNAEAYWSFDDKQLVFQSNFKDWGVNCD